MDHNNQKSLIPDFSANGFAGQFNGLPHGNANSLMSTLQSLQMQSMGTSMNLANDLQCDLNNQFLLEQIQLRALYNTFNGQKIDPKLPQSSQGGFTLNPFQAALASTSAEAAANVFSIPSTSQTNASQLLPAAALSAASVAASSMMIGQKFAESSTAKTLLTTPEDWMKSICVDTLLDPFKAKMQPALQAATIAAPAQPNVAESVDSADQEIVVVDATPSTSTPPEESTSTPLNEPSTSAAATIEKTPSEEPVAPALEYDEAHDDVDNIFGLSLVENDVRSGSLYNRQSNLVGGLSPIDYTPPDSPQGEMTLDELFGLTPAAPKKPAETSKKDQSSDIPSTSTDTSAFKTPTTSAATAAAAAAGKAEEDAIINFVKPKTIPVYKQKAALMSLEAREAARKDDPNYDAFEFDDDDDMAFGANPSDIKKESEPKKPEPKTKSVYITGVGFEIQSNSKDFPSKKHHSKQPVVQNSIDVFNEKAFFSIADSIRTRKDERMTCPFLKPEQSTSTDCAKDGRVFTTEEPALPKFIIKIERTQVTNEEPVARKRYKKRRKSENEDSDFDDTPYSRKRKITKKTYSLQQNLNGPIRRFMVHVPVGPCVPEADRKRISCFGPAEGILPKGTYVVCKADILKDDCAIWRVDNQNLLQKFPPVRIAKGDKFAYRSSSTYSGWCEQISSQYFRVSVRIIKQTRSETTIEPEIPLAKLFVASSCEWFKNPRTVQTEDTVAKTEVLDDDSILSDTKRVSINTLINAYLTQTFTLNHVQNLLEKNDWTYTRSISELETNNKQCEELIKKRIPVEAKHERYINDYTRVAVSKNSFYCLIKCQICKRKKPRRMIHFFDKQTYDAKFTFENKVATTSTADSIENVNKKRKEYPVRDAISCGRCAMAVDFLHQMRHIQLHLLRTCEDKLEEIGTSEIDLSSEKLIELAKADKHWVQSVIQKYCELWDQVRFHFRDV